MKFSCWLIKEVKRSVHVLWLKKGKCNDVVGNLTHLKLKLKYFWFLTFLPKYCKSNQINFIIIHTILISFTRNGWLGTPDWLGTHDGWLGTLKFPTFICYAVTRLRGYAVTHMLLYFNYTPNKLLHGAVFITNTWCTLYEL